MIGVDRSLGLESSENHSLIHSIYRFSILFSLRILSSISSMIFVSGKKTKAKIDMMCQRFSKDFHSQFWLENFDFYWRVWWYEERGLKNSPSLSHVSLVQYWRYFCSSFFPLFSSVLFLNYKWILTSRHHHRSGKSFLLYLSLFECFTIE